MSFRQNSKGSRWVETQNRSSEMCMGGMGDRSFLGEACQTVLQADDDDDQVSHCSAGKYIPRNACLS